MRAWEAREQEWKAEWNAREEEWREMWYAPKGEEAWGEPQLEDIPVMELAKAAFPMYVRIPMYVWMC